MFDEEGKEKGAFLWAMKVKLEGVPCYQQMADGNYSYGSAR